MLPLINSFWVIYKIILSVSINAPAVGALFFCFIEDTADYIGAFLFLGLIQMGIDIRRCGQIGMTEEGRYIQQRHILIDEDAGEGVPLRYNNDKQKKPLFSRGLSVCRLLFNSFSKLKIDENYKEKRRLFY